MTIRAIETAYAGCHFRSRLEARWAVFFDTLGIEWRYESEGFETPHGRYLPDFYLPESRRWVEVKGAAPTKHDKQRAAVFAESRWQVSEGFRLLIGDIPRSATAGPEQRGMLPVVIWAHVALPINAEAFPVGIPELTQSFPHRSEEPLPINASPGQLLEWGGLRNFHKTWWALAADVPGVNRALVAARSARFEYGESPDPLRAWFGETTTACSCMTWQTCDRCSG